MARDPLLDGRALAARCAPFQRAYVSSALLQLSGNLIGLVSAYAATGWLLLNGWAALAPLGWLVATVFIARTFLVQHDCGHAAFMPTRRLNYAVGRLVSLFTFTPYGFWCEAHNRHHATTGDLDRGHIGDVLTFSVRQFNALSPHDQRRYRRFRNMVLTLLVGAPIQFLLRYRIPYFMPFPPARCWHSVLGLDLGLLLLYGGAA